MYGFSFDMMCLQCNDNSIFKSSGFEKNKYYRSNYSPPFHYEELFYDLKKHNRMGLYGQCSRNSNHVAYFSLQIDSEPFSSSKDLEMSSETVLTKVGQYPSIASIGNKEYNKYKSVLEKEQLKELKRAVGLAAHGIGVGSFVYLRRIIEVLIEKAINQKYLATKDDDWKESIVKNRMAEKMKELHGYIPPFLVENTALYSVLSKGIHSLSEEDCLVAFEPLLMCIELILDDEVKRKQDEQKRLKAQSALSKLNQQHGKSNK